ncbi:hypothetical protein C6P42_002720 [Pichia californica]|nr:hypothetical protein C6P42_002720 [[Candida] californica]
MLQFKRNFSISKIVQAVDFTHTIIGGGVVGLAIGAELVQQSKNNNVLIIEKNEEYGQETSSRNSEVVHAGLYYPKDSLKTKLCIIGKNKIYQRKEFIPVRQCGKWIIAQNEQEMEYLEKLHDKSKEINVKTEFISLKRGKLDEPSIMARYAILNSPTTGITSAHEVMDYLATKFQEGEGNLALGTKVIGIEYIKGENVYEINTKTNEDDEIYNIKTSNIINCAGLYAPKIANMILPKDKHIKAYYAKGNYFSYNGPNPHINRLIYPCPTPGVASLGTHLTLDLGGQIRFGPDLEWVDNCDNYKVNEKNLDLAVEAVKVYFPNIKREFMNGSYSGIRPKLIGPEVKKFQDFVIRNESEIGHPCFINLLGIESPGLTASMGISEYVVKKFLS